MVKGKLFLLTTISLIISYIGLFYIRQNFILTKEQIIVSTIFMFIDSFGIGFNLAQLLKLNLIKLKEDKHGKPKQLS